MSLPGETNARKAVFRTDLDREQFLSYLQSARERYGAVIHVYCLLSNHYHLLLETPRGNLSQILHHINGAYTTYFNVKRDRSGHLFQGRFRVIFVENEEYAHDLSRYIHLNPYRVGLIIAGHHDDCSELQAFGEILGMGFIRLNDGLQFMH